MGPRSFAAPLRPVIAGLGITDVGKIFNRSAAQFAADAVRRAAVDAGITLRQLDGLLVAGGVTRGVDVSVQRDLGLTDLKVLAEIQSFGATAVQMVQYAALLVGSGSANIVACAFGDAPLRRGETSGNAYGAGRSLKGWRALAVASGLEGPNAMYALAAQRHMSKFGTTSEHLGHIAVAQRAWASLNPLAQMRIPITIDDHQDSRWVVEPLHLLDCCLVSNGGAAVIVTTAERSQHMAGQAVHVLGWAQSHPGHFLRRDEQFGLTTGAAVAGPAALRMARLHIDNVDVAELYDCYTYTVLVSLEDYGFCGKGEGGPFVASGVLGPSGSLKVNTGGGQLSSYYLWGMTPVTEGVIQARGRAGERQSAAHDVVLVSGNGGILDHHSTLILSPHPA
jgi:acetyl-CoA acetyltransferase